MLSTELISTGLIAYHFPLIYGDPPVMPEASESKRIIEFTILLSRSYGILFEQTDSETWVASYKPPKISGKAPITREEFLQYVILVAHIALGELSVVDLAHIVKYTEILYFGEEFLSKHVVYES